jgi:hypothetical protein
VRAFFGKQSLGKGYDDGENSCLAENGLHLTHYEGGRGILVRLMSHCTAVARRA